jgi:hypothetical protein
VLEWDGFLAAQQRGSDAVAFSQFMRRLGTAEKATRKLDKLEAQSKALITREVRSLETETLMTMAQSGVS